jgi:hypothetical protein
MSLYVPTDRDTNYYVSQLEDNLYVSLNYHWKSKPWRNVEILGKWGNPDDVVVERSSV